VLLNVAEYVHGYHTCLVENQHWQRLVMLPKGKEVPRLWHGLSQVPAIKSHLGEGWWLAILKELNVDESHISDGQRQALAKSIVAADKKRSREACEQEKKMRATRKLRYRRLREAERVESHTVGHYNGSNGLFPSLKKGGDDTAGAPLPKKARRTPAELLQLWLSGTTKGLFRCATCAKVSTQKKCTKCQKKKLQEEQQEKVNM
jgi:hypothetical protein